MVERPTKGLPINLPDFVYVVAINYSHAKVQMTNYGYVEQQGNNRGPVRKYRYVHNVDQLRGISGADICVLDGVQHCRCCRQSYYEIIEFVGTYLNRYTLTKIPEINSDGTLVKRPSYDLRNREE